MRKLRLECLGGLAVGLGLVMAAGAAAAPELVTDGGRYVLRGASLEMRWDAGTGALTRVIHAATASALLEGADRPFDLHTEKGWIFQTDVTRASRLGALVLDGEWDFHTEDGEGRKIRVPGAWEDQGVTQPGAQDPDPDWGPYNGNGYYRRGFDLPEGLRGKDVVLVIQRVDDFDWVTINGREIGHTGDEVEEWWARPRRYEVPAAVLKDTGNTIEVRVYDRGGEGGIIGSVMLLGAEQMEEMGRPPLALTGAHLETAGDVARVSLRYEGETWEATEVYEVAATGPGFFAREVELRARDGAGDVRFDAAEMPLGRVSAELMEAGSITAPYYWPPLREPLRAFATGKDVNQHSSQAVTGAGFYRENPALALAVGQYWERDWNRFVCHGGEGVVSIRTTYDCAGRLRPGLRIPFGGQFLCVSEGTGYREALRAIGEGWERVGFRRVATPEWAESIALYSCFPGGTMGSGLRDLRSPGDKPPALVNFRELQLPALQRLGVNALWFLPLWPRLYGVSDYRALDPSLGTVEDLRAVVRDAHDAGIRVLCDLIPHGPHESSGLLEEHPEFVSRHEDGSVLYWWGCLGCDYAHPGWQDYMADVATYWAKEADVDGWRVDCAGGSPANWKPVEGNLPSWSGQWGGLGHMRRVREEMTKIKPDSVLLAESANPSMLTQAQFIYDWPAETMLFRILEGPREEWVRHMAGWMDAQRLALPAGAAHGLMRFTENHDQMHSVWQLGAGLARPVWALIALAQGFPLIYHEQEVGFEDLWAKVLETRRALPELHRGEADYMAVSCDQPDVMAFVRRAGEVASLVSISFGGEARRCRLGWAGAPRGLAHARVLPTGEAARVEREGEELAVTVDVPAGEWRVVALRASEEELAALPVARGMEPIAVEPTSVRWEGLRARLVVRAGDGERVEEVGRGGRETMDEGSGELAGVTVEAEGGWRLDLRNGLLAGIARGEEVLLDGMWVREGDSQVSWGEPLRLGGRRAQAGPSPEQRVGMVPRRWRVAAVGDAVEIDWEGQGEEFALESRYVVRPDGTVEATVRLTPREASEPVIGQLYLAMASPQANRWEARGFEGAVGGPFVVRHPTDREITGRFWHPIQRLWEHSVQPLSLDTPAVGWQAGGQWVWLQMSDYPSDAVLDDMYLREYDPEGNPGLTAYLEWMAGRSGRALDPEEPFAARFTLKVGGSPEARQVKLPVRFWADGANWYVENGHYRACLARSEGGQLRWLWAPGQEGSIISQARTYTDQGLLGQVSDSLGRQQKATGSTSGDFEPDCWIEPGEEELRVRFRGYMRVEQMFQSLSSPRIQVETVWRFTDGPRIGVEHRARAMIPPRGQDTGFLSQVLSVPEVGSWRAEIGGKEQAGTPETDGSGRIMQTKEIGGDLDYLELTARSGRLRLDNLRPWGDGPQNVFLLRDRDRANYVIFLAMLDGVRTDFDARWRGYAYDLTVGAPVGE